jgi:hypothetical protein
MKKSEGGSLIDLQSTNNIASQDEDDNNYFLSIARGGLAVVSRWFSSQNERRKS